MNLADAAPEPAFALGGGVVIAALCCLLVVAAVGLAVVLVQRNRKGPGA